MELRYPLRPAPARPAEPAPEFALLRREQPVVRVDLPVGGTGWLVTRYADNKALLGDARLSRAAAARSGGRTRATGLEADAVTTTDPPRHTALRQAVAGAFSPSRIDGLAPAVESVIAEAVADVAAAGPPADLVALLTRPVPLRVISAVLGLPRGDEAWFAEVVGRYLRVGGPPEDLASAGAELRAYFGGLLTSGTGLLAELAERLTEAETVAFAITLLMAGFAPTSHLLAQSVFTLCSHGEWSRLAGTPELLDSAVEELLRYCPVAASGGTVRVATDELELGGVTIVAGDAVLPALVSANRDAAVFSDADQLDLARTPNRHLAFGHGLHRCLGSRLARLELRATLAALLTAFPGLRLAVPAEDVPWQLDGMQRGPAQLPVTW